MSAADVKARLQAIADATGRSIYDVADDALTELWNEITFDRATENRRNLAMRVLYDILDEQDDNFDSEEYAHINADETRS